jgi:hypothetical protein
MATTFKALKPEDKVLTRNILHESIPITGTMVSSSTYADNNIKNYSHGMFQSVFDYPFLSSSANHIFDITFGNSNLSSSNGNFKSSMTLTSESGSKQNVYAEMAQVLCGHFPDGAIRPFDVSGSLSAVGDYALPAVGATVDETGDKMRDVIFLNFARLLTKDEIKKGTFELELGTARDSNFSGGGSAFGSTVKIKDTDAASSYKVNSPAGEFGVLKITDGTGTQLSASANSNVGLIFYQAGIVVLSGSVFRGRSAAAPSGSGDKDSMGMLKESLDMTGNSVIGGVAGQYQAEAQRGLSIRFNADAVRRRIKNITFNNTTELNSTVYFCRANAHEFNYSSNPTYLSGSEIRVRPAANADAEPVSYVTTVGLYGPNNEMLAVAKTSEPLKKSPSNELTLRVRLDY